MLGEKSISNPDIVRVCVCVYVCVCVRVRVRVRASLLDCASQLIVYTVLYPVPWAKFPQPNHRSKQTPPKTRPIKTKNQKTQTITQNQTIQTQQTQGGTAKRAPPPNYGDLLQAKNAEFAAFANDQSIPMLDADGQYICASCIFIAVRRFHSIACGVWRAIYNRVLPRTPPHAPSRLCPCSSILSSHSVPLHFVAPCNVYRTVPSPHPHPPPAVFRRPIRAGIY